jgi:ComF family protein
LINVYSAYWKILDWLFPPNCAGCNAGGYRFCPDCYKKANFISEPKCCKCGDNLKAGVKITCNRCHLFPSGISAVRSWAYYDGVLQKAIRNLKYNGDIGLGETLASLLLEVLIKESWSIDLVIGVPLDHYRYKERGYNQSVYLSRPLAHLGGLPHSVKAIKRIRQTRSQVGLSSGERLINVDGAFLADRKIVSRKTILIIDDVITTGATINACTSALLSANAYRVYGITLARAKRLLAE